MQLSQVLAREGGPIGAPSAGRGGRGGGGARGRGRARGRGTTAGGGVILGPFGGAASAPQEAKEGAVGELTANKHDNEALLGQGVGSYSDYDIGRAVHSGNSVQEPPISDLVKRSIQVRAANGGPKLL